MSSSAEAVLQTGEIETRYVRAGTGAPMLLLFHTALTDPLAAALFAQLAARYRVVAPHVPAGVGSPGMPLATWLRALVDGLGLVRPTAIADESLAGTLLGFSLVDPGRIAGVVAVCRDDADPATSVGMLHAAHGLLVVAVDSAEQPAKSAELAIAEIVRFVDGGSA
ncbi:MAG TPA: hypothetical protein VM513_04135 [Kofleriaceae bacterium]|nr:hypothetical protein [Kofleriaceae bacterium]